MLHEHFQTHRAAVNTTRLIRWMRKSTVIALATTPQKVATNLMTTKSLLNIHQNNYREINADNEAFKYISKIQKKTENHKHFHKTLSQIYVSGYTMY